MLEAGLPQGSVLSAALFWIFSNDLLHLKFKGQIIVFADDIPFFYSYKSTDTLGQTISQDLKLLIIRCEENKVDVNVFKANFIIEYLGYG